MRNYIAAAILSIIALPLAHAQRSPLLFKHMPRIVKDIVEARDRGVPKAEVIAKYPKHDEAANSFEKEIPLFVDEIYEHTWVNFPAYYAYTWSRKDPHMDQSRVPTKFSQVADNVRLCQEKIPDEYEQISCVISVVTRYPDGP